LLRGALLLVGLAFGSSTAYLAWRYSGPGPVLPAELAELDPELVALIQDRAAQVRSSPRNAAAHGRLGLVYEANGMFDPARRCFENAIDLAHDPLIWNYHLAIVVRQAGDYQRSLDMLRALADRYPRFTPLHHRLGVALLEGGQVEDAERAFQVAHDNAPTAPAPMVGLADVKLRHGDYAGAATLLERAVEIDPDFKAAHYSLGLAYRGLGRADEAARELSMGLNARPRYLPDQVSGELIQCMVMPAARIERAEQLVAAGHLAEAAALLEKGLVTRPDDGGLMNNLAKVYIDLERLDEAIALLLRCQQTHPHDFRTLVNLCHCCLKMKRYEEALAYADQAVELGPTSVRSHLSRASVLGVLKRYTEAAPALEEAIRLEPYSAELRLRLADTCKKLERYPEAMAHFQAAARLNPKLLAPQIQLGLLSIKLGDVEGAAAALAAARRLKPEDPRVLALQHKLRTLQDATGNKAQPD
jgi:tetratricopeptide (TPR) repeat protein